MSTLKVLLVLCLVMPWAGSASAQQVSDYVRIASRPSWIVPVDLPDYDSADDKGRDSVYPLIDYQNRHDLTNDIHSTRYVVDLFSAAAVEDKGTLSLDFDPLYETLTLHKVAVTRNGRILDAADLSEATVFRTETNRNQMIFNGTLTFLMPVLDLRVGDRLEVAYTRRGRNPAIGTGIFTRRTFGSGEEVKRRFIRTAIGPGIQPIVKTINDPPDPRRTKEAGWTVFEWDYPDPRAADDDQDAPPWAYLGPVYEISNFETWSSVGDLFANTYEIGADDRAAVGAIVTEIAELHKSPKARSRAALDWVQTNIRYIGLELVEGGFIPREPTRVLKRRFGDCKDVTLLLLALLDGLGIDADPVLVHTDERGGEFKGLPNPYAFDHIMVVADIDGSLYPLDATRDPQIGTLDTMEKGDIAFGLRLIDGASVITRLPQSDYAFREVLIERFDLVAEPDAILYSLKFQEYGEDADATLSWLARDGEMDVLDSFVRYLTDIYPTLEAVEPLRWSSNADMASTTLDFQFRLSGFGPDGKTTFETRAYQLLSAVPSFDGTARSAPFMIDHPRRVHHIREYVGDERYNFEASSQTFEKDAFRFVYKDTVNDHVLREDYRWISKQDHISAEDFEKDMAVIQEITNLSYTTLNLARADNVSSERDGSTGFPWLILSG